MEKGRSRAGTSRSPPRKRRLARPTFSDVAARRRLICIIARARAQHRAGAAEPPTACSRKFGPVIFKAFEYFMRPTMGELLRGGADVFKSFSLFAFASSFHRSRSSGKDICVAGAPGAFNSHCFLGRQFYRDAAFASARGPHSKNLINLQMIAGGVCAGMQIRILFYSGLQDCNLCGKIEFELPYRYNDFIHNR